MSSRLALSQAIAVWLFLLAGLHSTAASQVTLSTAGGTDTSKTRIAVYADGAIRAVGLGDNGDEPVGTGSLGLRVTMANNLLCHGQRRFYC